MGSIFWLDRYIHLETLKNAMFQCKDILPKKCSIRKASPVREGFPRDFHSVACKEVEPNVLALQYNQTIGKMKKVFTTGQA